ncbi:sugar kinase [Kribbella sandramycini]|uniref:2-dehydro-3-deoxygluconokinase n=1 Tax=Kribbella sandramycini TaxID=60450 RepID=A0A7Y4P1Y6_9ACTN|nr:sugar kinase [Kribbella sandramycini]MBB6571179.1 2-dehydro-3-deoxygluconokinase [Kribbella sandramycini]NOL43413.1 sugar kinase [Kribbella sandramycini]
MTDLLTIGETMVSLRTPRAMRLGGGAHLSIAGSETNVAIGVARLGHQAAWLGAVGNDEPGRLIQRTLRAEGVDTTQMRFDDDNFTGFIAFDQPSHDITRVSYHRRGSAGSTLTDADCTRALETTTPRLLHVTGITPALSPTTRAATLTAVRAARAAGVQVSLDVNYRARLWSRADAATALRELLPHIHTVFASDDELDILTDAEDPVAALLTTAAEVVVTAGGKGAWSHTTSGTLHRPALPVTVVDSIGAGDAFVSGYLSATLDHLTPEARLDRATTSGAFCVTALGDWESLPTRQDLTLLTHAQGTALR